MPDEKDAQGNDQNNGAQGNQSAGLNQSAGPAFDQDAFFTRLKEELRSGQQQDQQGRNSGAQGNNNQGGSANNDQVLSAIQALPEQFANVIKEMNPGATSNDAGKESGDSNSGGDAGKENEHTPGKPKGFADWWYNR